MLLMVPMLFGLMILPAGCGPISIQPTSTLLPPTPYVPNFGARPHHFPIQGPLSWDCSVITEVSPGLAWQGLQIGITTYEEMVELLQPDRVYRYAPNNRIVFQRGNSDRLTNDPLKILGACFLGDTLSALEVYVSTEEFPSDIINFTRIYGAYDRVTWGYNASTRTMIWADDGVMAIIERIVGGHMDGELIMIPYILFPPIDPEKLGESWLMQWIPQPGSFFNNLAGLPPEWRVEDPWSYND